MSKHILAVDDDEAVRKSFILALEAAEYQTDTNVSIHRARAFPEEFVGQLKSAARKKEWILTSFENQLVVSNLVRLPMVFWKSQQDIKEDAMCELRLYVSGKTLKSVKTAGSLTKFFEGQFKRLYSLEIADFLENPRLANKEKIFATPTKVPEQTKSGGETQYATDVIDVMLQIIEGGEFGI